MPAENVVKLAVTDFGVDVFDPSIEGVDPITKSGTEVPASQEKPVRKAARENGVSLRRVK